MTYVQLFISIFFPLCASFGGALLVGILGHTAHLEYEPLPNWCFLVMIVAGLTGIVLGALILWYLEQR